MKWVDFVKDYADKHNIMYGEALKTKECKEGYKKQKLGGEIPVNIDSDSSSDSESDKENITFKIVPKRGRKQKYDNDVDRKSAKKEQTKISNSKHYEKKGTGAKIEKEIMEELHKILHQLYEHRRISGEGILDHGKRYVKNVVEKAHNVVEKVKNLKNIVLHGRKEFTPRLQTLLARVGDKPIKSMTIYRAIVPKYLTTLVNFASGGEFNNQLKDKPYDDVFHLSLYIETTDGNCYNLEKNTFIEMAENPKNFDKEVEHKTVPNLPADLTINKLLEKAHNVMGDDKFFGYSAKDNNCQDFVMKILKASGLGTSGDFDFVKQDTQSFFGDKGFARKAINTITDIAAATDVISHGSGIDFADLKKGAFTRQLKTFNKGHNKKLSMEEFARYVLENNEKFNTITHKRARFYLDVLLK